MRFALAAVTLSFLLACEPPESPPTVQPEDGGQTLQPADAGSSGDDAGAPDASTNAPDASTDAGAPDAGAEDAGTTDAGTDAGSTDAGTTDAGTTDAGVHDAGCVCVLPSYCDSSDHCVADTRAPQVTVSAQANASHTQLHVSGTAADAETGVARVEVRLGSSAPVSAVVQAGQWQVDLPITLSGPTSTFTITASARDFANNEGTATTTLTIDVNGPVITLTPAQSGACMNGVCTGAVVSASANAFVLSATVSDPSGLAALSPVRVRVLDGMTELVPPTDLQSSGAGGWAWTWSTLPLVDGRAYTLEVTAVDALGNVTTATLSVFIDRVAPSIALTPAQDGACTAGACTGAFVNGAASGFALSANVLDGQSLAAAHAVRVRVLDGATELVPPTDLSAAGSVWSWLWTTLPAVDGRAYQLEVTATDAVGNQTTARRTVLVDRLGPSLALTPAQSATCGATSCTGAVVSVANSSFQLSAAAGDGLGLAAMGAVRVRVLDGASVVVPSTDLVLQAGAWSFTWPAPLVDGRYYSMEVTATDAAGNTTMKPLVVLVDRINPTLLVNSPRQGTLVGAVQVSVNASATDGFGLRAVEVATSPSGPWVAATLDANGDWVASLPVPVVDAVEQTLQVRATDLVGNTRIGTTQYTADRVAPTLELTDLGDFDCTGPDRCSGSVANLQARQVTYSGTVADGSAVTLERVITDGAGDTHTATGPQAHGAWTWVWNYTGAIDGAGWEFSVVAIDAAQNRSVRRVRRTWVDTVAPTMSLPSAGQRLVSRLAPVVTFSEPMSAASVRAATTLAPAAALPLSSADARSFGYAAGGLAAYTPYTLTIGTAALDKAGNAVSAAGTASFLTEVAPLANPATVVSSMASYAHRLPKVVVDADGRPNVFVATGRVGSSQDPTSAVFTYTGRDWLPASVPGLVTDLRIASATQLADRRLDTTLGVLYAGWSATSSSLWVDALATTPLTWAGAVKLGAMPATNATSMGSYRPSLEYVPWRRLIIGGGSTSGVDRVVHSAGAPATGSYTVNQWTDGGGSWTSTAAGSFASSLSQLDARATIDTVGSFTSGTVSVRVFDGVANGTAASAPMNSTSAPATATAQPPLKVANNLGGADRVSATWAAWASAGGALTIACNGAFPSGTWQSTTVALAARTSGSLLTSALSAQGFVVVGEFGGNLLVYRVAQPASCASAPVLALVGTIVGGREPAVAVAPNGTVWVAYVSNGGAVQLQSF